MVLTEVDTRVNKGPESVGVTVVIVSDTATDRDTASGLAICESLSRAGHRVMGRTVVKHDVQAIRAVLRELVETREVQAVVIIGGTGLCRREATLEAVEPFQEKTIPGFGELLRMHSYTELGSVAMTLRATAFASEGKVVFCLPDLEPAARLAVDRLIAPDLGRLVREANG